MHHNQHEHSETTPEWWSAARHVQVLDTNDSPPEHLPSLTTHAPRCHNSQQRAGAIDAHTVQVTGSHTALASCAADRSQHIPLITIYTQRPLSLLCLWTIDIEADLDILPPRHRDIALGGGDYERLATT
jgi:hypothetical protein